MIGTMEDAIEGTGAGEYFGDCTREEKEFLLELDRHLAYIVFPITSRNILAEQFRITDEDAKWMIKEAVLSDKNPHIESSRYDLTRNPPENVLQALRAIRAL